MRKKYGFILVLVLLSSFAVGQKKLLAKGESAFSTRDFYCAIKYYGEAYNKKAKKNYHVNKRLAQSFLFVKDFAKADRFYGQAILMEDAEPAIFKEYADLLLFQNRFAKAKELLNLYKSKEGADQQAAATLLQFIDLRISTPPDSIIIATNKKEDVCYEIDGTDFVDIKGDIYDLHWEHEDGFKATGLKYDYCFKEGGRHTIALHLENRVTGITDFSDTILVVDVPYARVYSIDGNHMVGKDLIFNASNIASTLDNEGGKFIWDFNDGTFGVGEQPKKRFDRSGVYQINLWVIETDDSGTELLSFRVQGDLKIELKFLVYSCTEEDVPDF